MVSIREQRQAKIKEALGRAQEAYKAEDYSTALKVLMPYRSDKRVQQAISKIEKVHGKAAPVPNPKPFQLSGYPKAFAISIIIVCGFLFFMSIYLAANPPSQSPSAVTDDTPIPTVATTSMPVHADIYYSNMAGAYVRSCTEGNCEILAALPAGEEVDFIDFAEGAEISGSTVWYRVRLSDGREGYIHSTVVSDVRPTPAPTRIPPRNTQAPSSSGGSTSGSGNNSSQRPGNCSTAVAMGLSAQQAAEWDHLDRDDDGVACYGD